MQQMVLGLDVRQWVYLVDMIVKSIIEDQIPNILKKEYGKGSSQENPLTVSWIINTAYKHTVLLFRHESMFRSNR